VRPTIIKSKNKITTNVELKLPKIEAPLSVAKEKISYSNSKTYFEYESTPSKRRS
jgi:predicted component of type VI protein secretion system